MSAGPQIPLFDPDGGGPGPEEEGPAPGASRETALPVSALNEAARRVLEASIGRVWVVGEVANWKAYPSGHRYFSLREDAAQLSCVMFRGDARRLPTDPEEGMEVLARGDVSIYPERGAYQLIVRRLEARGEGLWRLAFERLRRRLAAEGLLDPARKRALPEIPACVGVVSSRSGAAVRDVISVVRRRAPWTRLLLADCRVQGEGAADEVRRALERLTVWPGVEVVIVTRGGGSVEDLWAFNDEALARAIVASPVPVVSAVGHEVDVTIADLVADVRAPTPSAAAELAVPDAAELRGRLRSLARGMAGGLRRRRRRGEERAGRGGERLVAAIQRRLERAEHRVARSGDRLQALSPLATLRRGYAVALDDEGTVLRRVHLFREGEPFRLRVADGSLRCTAGAVLERGEEA